MALAKGGSREAHLSVRLHCPGHPSGNPGCTRLFPAEATLPMPDPSLQNQVGPPGVFQDVGLTTMGRLNMAGLRPEHDVLDIGCGVGRTARFLCDHLSPEAHYEGFDIMESLMVVSDRDNSTIPQLPIQFRSAVQLGIPVRCLPAVSSRAQISLSR